MLQFQTALLVVKARIFMVPSGNQTWQSKMDQLSVISLSKPPFIGDFPASTFDYWRVSLLFLHKFALQKRYSPVTVWPRPCLERPLLRRLDGMAGRERRATGGDWATCRDIIEYIVMLHCATTTRIPHGHLNQKRSDETNYLMAI